MGAGVVYNLCSLLVVICFWALCREELKHGL